jgi:pimeloyl-ACP methyl ester carboxylesterase
MPVLIAGESLGALTALALVQTEPQWVERLVLINVPLFPRQLPSWGMRSLAYLPLELVQWVDQQRLIRPFAPLVQAMTRWVRREVVVDPDAITDEEIYWLTYPYLQIPGTLTQFTADLQLAAREIDRLHRHQSNLLSTIQQKLPQTACPTLILWSDCDRWFPVEDGERLHAWLPNSQLQVLPNCGHVASSGNPEAVNRAILHHCLDFISEQT